MKRPNRKNYINNNTTTQLIADLEIYIDYLQTSIDQLHNNQKELLLKNIGD